MQTLNPQVAYLNQRAPSVGMLLDAQVQAVIAEAESIYCVFGRNRAPLNRNMVRFDLTGRATYIENTLQPQIDAWYALPIWPPRPLLTIMETDVRHFEPTIGILRWPGTAPTLEQALLDDFGRVEYLESRFAFSRTEAPKFKPIPNAWRGKMKLSPWFQALTVRG